MILSRFSKIILLVLQATVFFHTEARASGLDSVVHSNRLPPARAKLARQIHDIYRQNVSLPALPLNYDKNRYINTTPKELEESLKGKIVLLEVWDYTSVNSIRALPYLKEWNERYKNKGLVIVGVHSPEFAFEKDLGNLDSAVARFGINYAVIADNDLDIWQSLSNKTLPTNYIYDAEGLLRAVHSGEGDYQNFEAFIQELLLDRDSTLDLPELMAPLREGDKPGVASYRTTPETYVGFARGHLGNVSGFEEDDAHTYHAPAELKPDLFYLDGRWTVHDEFAQPSGGVAKLLLNYEAKEVNVIVRPLLGSGFKVWVEQDGAPLTKADRGADVQEESGRTFIYIDSPRTYNIVSNAKFGRYTLKLSSDSPSFGVYAFMFTSTRDPG